MKNILTKFIAVAVIFIAVSVRAEAPKQAAKGIEEGVSKLKAIYDADVKQMLAPQDSTEIKFKSADELLVESKLLTNSLVEHIHKIEMLDFDILLSAQDWDASWTVTFGDPVKKAATFEVPVLLKRTAEQTTVTWKFVNKNGSWQIDDATYVEPGQKPFTLRSLPEGDGEVDNDEAAE